MVAQLLHLIQHRDRVDGLGVIEHGVDGLEDLTVLLEVEILRLYHTHHIGDAAAVDEDRAQNSLLRFYRLGRLLLKQFFIHAKFSFLFLVAEIHVLSCPGKKGSRGNQASMTLMVRGAVIS